jgi:hypothetical protein
MVDAVGLGAWVVGVTLAVVGVTFAVVGATVLAGFAVVGAAVVTGVVTATVVGATVLLGVPATVACADDAAPITARNVMAARAPTTARARRPEDREFEEPEVKGAGVLREMRPTARPGANSGVSVVGDRSRQEHDRPLARDRAPSGGPAPAEDLSVIRAAGHEDRGQNPGTHRGRTRRDGRQRWWREHE